MEKQTLTSSELTKLSKAAENLVARAEKYNSAEQYLSFKDDYEQFYKEYTELCKAIKEAFGAESKLYRAFTEIYVPPCSGIFVSKRGRRSTIGSFEAGWEDGVRRIDVGFLDSLQDGIAKVSVIFFVANPDDEYLRELLLQRIVSEK
ncbi:hypothetical protein GF367_01575 [Candidatus Woesearchaeota archaeon]|nr:hypothetical protein [Candidatus Woesearchaeota archaeon]